MLPGVGFLTQLETSALTAFLHKVFGPAERDPPGEVSPFFGIVKACLLGIVYFRLKASRLSIRLGIASIFHFFVSLFKGGGDEKGFSR